MTLDDKRITEIEPLRAGITPPPWTNDWGCVKAAAGIICRIFYLDLARDADANAAFIAASPAIVDDLLAERRELVAEVERLRKYDPHRGYHDVEQFYTDEYDANDVESLV